jgi:hypothetical protein
VRLKPKGAQLVRPLAFVTLITAEPGNAHGNGYRDHHKELAADHHGVIRDGRLLWVTFSVSIRPRWRQLRTRHM